MCYRQTGRLGPGFLGSGATQGTARPLAWPPAPSACLSRSGPLGTPWGRGRRPPGWLRQLQPPAAPGTPCVLQMGGCSERVTHYSTTAGTRDCDELRDPLPGDSRPPSPVCRAQGPQAPEVSAEGAGHPALRVQCLAAGPRLGQAHHGPQGGMCRPSCASVTLWAQPRLHGTHLWGSCFDTHLGSSPTAALSSLGWLPSCLQPAHLPPLCSLLLPLWSLPLSPENLPPHSWQMTSGAGSASSRMGLKTSTPEKNYSSIHIPGMVDTFQAWASVSVGLMKTTGTQRTVAPVGVLISLSH